MAPGAKRESESEMAKQKLTQKQREDRIRAAEERERRAEEAKKRKERTKQIFTIVVCVILVLALGIPTVGLTLLGGGASL